jgi:uncharacterized membrane protein YadS
MEGADAVGGVLSVTTVDVVFVSAANNKEGKSTTNPVIIKIMRVLIISP